MKHLEAALNSKNAWWRYLVMIVAILIASNTIGSIPLLIPFFKTLVSNPEAAQELAKNPSDFSSLGVDPYYGLFMMLFPFVAALVAFALLVKPLHERTFRVTLTGSSSFRWNHFFISFIAWIVLSAIYLFAYMKVEPSNFILSNTTISLLFISLIALALIPFQAGLEEVVFRGYLMQGFASLIRYRWFPLIMTSLLFGLMHAFNPEVKEFGFFTMMPQYIAFGLIFGLVAVMDDGIEASIGAHAANNIFLVIMVTHESSALQTPALYEQKTIYPWTEFTGLVISGVVFIILLKIIFGWKGFDRLFERIQSREESRV
ncbi:MAG: lysostaphin resistance A-like protein [Chloroflexota bacterium]